MKKKMLLIPLVMVLILNTACGKAKPPAKTIGQTARHATSQAQSTNKATSQASTAPLVTQNTVKPTVISTPTPAPQSSGIVNVFKEYTTAQLRKDADALAGLYPDVIKTQSIGTTTKGNDIILLKLGKGDKKVLMIGEMHARENITSSYLMRVIEEYASAYTNNIKYGKYDVKNLLDENTIYFVPVSNPDGLDIVTNNIKPNITVVGYDEFWSTLKANGNGVDLNANFPFYWDEINIMRDRPRSELYRGPSAGSENETQALMNLCFNNNFEFMLSFHIRGRVLYWRDAGNGILPGDEKLANTISVLTGYAKQSSTLVPETDSGGGYAGGFENWFRFATKKPGICIEMIKGGTGSEPYKNTDFENANIMNWAVTKYLALEVLVD